MEGDRHSEIEIKLDADQVEVRSFTLWCMDRNPAKYVKAFSPDVFYELDGNIVRHRWSDGAGELTVKKRKSSTSIIDRVEVNLNFSPCTTTEDVTKFLTASGWKRAFTLVKDASIFWFEFKRYEITVAIYEVGLAQEGAGLKNKHRFIECEIERGSHLDLIEAKDELERWRKEIAQRFPVGNPLKESLYELYSGKKLKGGKDGAEKRGKGSTTRGSRRFSPRPRPNRRATTRQAK